MTPDVTSVVQEILDRAAETGAVPGATYVITDAAADAREITAGTLRAGGDEPVRASTMYRLMTMTKAVASVGALLAADA